MRSFDLLLMNSGVVWILQFACDLHIFFPMLFHGILLYLDQSIDNVYLKLIVQIDFFYIK